MGQICTQSPRLFVLQYDPGFKKWWTIQSNKIHWYNLTYFPSSIVPETAVVGGLVVMSRIVMFESHWLQNDEVDQFHLQSN